MKPPIPRLQCLKVKGNVYDQMRTTVGVIGKAIRDGSKYLPIRNRAAALASTAPAKDYLGQVNAIFEDFVKRWRYVKDPTGQELVTTSPAQIYHLVMGGRSEDPGVGLGKGAGDCDDACVAIGAQLASIGFPVRIATIAPQGAPPGRLMSHVFCQAEVPIGNTKKWITVDPVVYPNNSLGYTPPHSRIAIFSLSGAFLGGAGNLRNMSGAPDAKIQEESMYLNQMQDLSGPEDWAPGAPLDFRKYGIKDFGIYAEIKGILDLGDAGISILAEVEEDHLGRAWTPILEMTPDDWDHVQRTGRPYHGMLALSDDLEVYTYDEGLGFFKKLFKKIKKRVKKVAKKLLAKIPGGKMLMKLGKKIWKVSKKLVGPLVKFVGKYAKKLAPIAALIPGYGPAIAAALYTAGKVANIMQKFGVKVTSKKGDPVGKLKFKSGKAAKKFKKAIAKAAKKEKRKGKRLDAPRRRKRRGRPGRVGPRRRGATRIGRRPAIRGRGRAGMRRRAA